MWFYCISFTLAFNQLSCQTLYTCIPKHPSCFSLIHHSSFHIDHNRYSRVWTSHWKKSEWWSSMKLSQAKCSLIWQQWPLRRCSTAFYWIVIATVIVTVTVIVIDIVIAIASVSVSASAIAIVSVIVSVVAIAIVSVSVIAIVIVSAVLHNSLSIFILFFLFLPFLLLHFSSHKKDLTAKLSAPSIWAKRTSL